MKSVLLWQALHLLAIGWLPGLAWFAWALAPLPQRQARPSS
jgi:hypothetical protein